ncbi:MAG: hypothetical protein NT031_15635 [Planctomycetota bacterium]|nr:hypothetical protein [Planctomycetota bacterium]
MLVLRCTTKVFRKVGGKPRAIEVAHAEPTFGAWYVNTIDYLNAGNLVMALLHEASWYTLLIPVAPAMDAEGLVTAFSRCLLAKLIELETTPEAIQRVMADYQSGAVLAKTTSRKTLGHLTAVVRDMEFVLEAGEPYVAEGNKLVGPCIEHWLNVTPRGGLKDFVWPLEEFWRRLRDLCPELPPRRSIHLWRNTGPKVIEYSEEVFGKHLPPRLAQKLLATLAQVDVLYTADELQAVEKAIRRVADPKHGLPPDLVEDIHRQARIQRDRMLQE